ncbi:MAG: MotA/TolQ/ExbB proton channel family protein [Deltaproteobacteria bacterium]|nr:MotA/TolQ/ExbB proton channel family protein [Deltaproteobacteria bacterium]
MSLQHIFEKLALLGAEWVLWLLVVLSVLSIAVMLDRVLFFRRIRTNLAELSRRLRDMLARDDVDGAMSLLDGDSSVEAAVARAGLVEAHRGPVVAEEAMASARVQQKLRLERWQSFLGTLGNNAPFIGLFGTVIGIIKAFHTLSISTNPEMKFIMADIGQALVATGVGLIVAIPAVVAHNVLQRKVRQVMGRTEAVGHVVMAYLRSEGGKGQKSSGGAVESDDGSDSEARS